MQNFLFTVDYTRTDWIKRFAYRLMLCRNEFDTPSALLVADTQFDGLRGSEPEIAAERFVDRSNQSPALSRLHYRDEPSVARRSGGVPAPQLSRTRVNATAVE